MTYRTHLVQYTHGKDRYAVTILAKDQLDAEARVKAIRESAQLLDAPHADRTVDSLNIESWNSAITAITRHLEKLTLDPYGLPVGDPMIVAPILAALSKDIKERFLIIGGK